MGHRIRTSRDHQLKYPVRVVILKQSPDGQPFWPIPDPPPPTIDARCESSLFHLSGRYDIACGDLLIDNPSSISNPHWVNNARCHLVEYVGAGKTFGFVVAKLFNYYDVVKLSDRIYLANDFIKLYKPNPIDDLDAFVASLTKRESYQSRPRFAILKQSPDGQPFWPIPSPLPPKADACLVWNSGPYYLFRFPGQHNIIRGDLLMGYSDHYIVEQVSIKKTSCLVFTEPIDVVELPNRIYLKEDFIRLHKPDPIDDLVEFVASLTIDDVFADHWPPEHEHANIYIFRDADVIFYVGSSPKSVYNRIRAHLGIGIYFGHFELHTLVEDNLPNSRNWNIDLYRVNSTNVSDILRCERQIIQRLCPIVNIQGNPFPMPLPMRYKWRLRR